MKREVKRFVVAFSGLFRLLTTDSHGRFHLLATILVVIAGFYFNISSVEWIAVLLCCAMVISAEGFNTSIERMADFIHKEQNENIRYIKDIAAGAVLVTAIIALAVACIVFIPKIR